MLAAGGTMTMLTRRRFLGLSAGSTAAALVGGATRGLAAMPHTRLRARPAQAQLLGLGGPATPVWAYNGLVPGPEIRLRRGQRARIEVENRLPQETTIHWHGLRIPNAMDGVPYLTQAPIPPGGTFVYEFEAPDAGTFWYHSHVRSPEQQGRGLYGAFIVDEYEPPAVDRDVTWVVDDWRLADHGSIEEPFNDSMDLGHAGRLGNVATLNGNGAGVFEARAGERLRLRLINTANARIFALRFEGHRPIVVALDGQPVEPHELERQRVVLPPAAWTSCSTWRATPARSSR
jgi:FtsP/CotA-like multicopper oxidase with cupredoxin domain